MQKIIPAIYFYLLSLIGMVLFIIGIFQSIHYIVGVTAYEKYPLRYGTESRCAIQPMAPEKVDVTFSRVECLRDLDAEREKTKVEDLEKAITFTLIGSLVFGVHFYFARKRI